MHCISSICGRERDGAQLPPFTPHEARSLARSFAALPLTSLVYGYIEMTAAAAATRRAYSSSLVLSLPRSLCHRRITERTNERTLVHCPSFDEIAFPAAAPPPPRSPLPGRLPICSPNEKRSTAAAAAAVAAAAALRSLVRSFLGSFSSSLPLFLFSRSSLPPSFDAASFRLFPPTATHAAAARR